jgi:hypothetical protein
MLLPSVLGIDRRQQFVVVALDLVVLAEHGGVLFSG